MCRDLLTDLPDSIIHIILMRMPIRDAINTSLLSTEWRYKWTEITQIVFDKNLVLQRVKMKREDIVNFINTTLILHKGPIHKFVLSDSILHFWPDIDIDVDRCIFHLSRNGIRELIIVMVSLWWSKRWNVPSCLFNCDKLTHLELHGCKIHTPKNFKGFSSLKILGLHRITSVAEDIQSLISSCLILDTLFVKYILVHSKVHIEAPRLKCLTFEGEPDDIVLVNTPLLASFSASMLWIDSDPQELSSENTFYKSFGAMPPLERLVGRAHFTKCLSVGCHIAPISLAVTYSHLTVIELNDVRFDDIKELEVVIRWLIISPILHTFTVSACHIWESTSREVVSWNKESFADSKLERLRHVKFKDMCGNPNELLLVEFLLERSPLLETLKISTSNSIEAAECDQLRSKLMRFGRTSARAQIIVSTYY